MKALSDVILSDPLVTALENRALREGHLSEQDYKMSEFIRPTRTPASPAEGTALDLVCLYDKLFVESKRYDFHSLTRSIGENVIRQRGDNIKGFSFAFRGEREIEYLGVNRSDFEDLKSACAYEANVILRRDVNFYLKDAERAFESEALKRDWVRNLSFSVEIPHRPTTEFLQRNLFWLIDTFEYVYGDGEYNKLIEVDDLRGMQLPKELIQQFEFFSESARFDSYFSFLQEAWVTLYESSFLGHLSSFEVAYERSPVRGVVMSRQADVDRVSRVIRINLADVVDYFPLPRTLEEAVEFRGHPRVESFKAALDRWLRSFSDDVHLERKLRHELQLANRDIKLLGRWRSIREKPIFFGVKMAAQAIPFMGAAVTGLDVIEYFLERHVGRRWAWVVAPHSRID